MYNPLYTAAAINRGFGHVAHVNSGFCGENVEEYTFILWYFWLKGPIVFIGKMVENPWDEGAPW